MVTSLMCDGTSHVIFGPTQNPLDFFCSALLVNTMIIWTKVGLIFDSAGLISLNADKTTEKEKLGVWQSILYFSLFCSLNHHLTNVTLLEMRSQRSFILTQFSSIKLKWINNLQLNLFHMIKCKVQGFLMTATLLHLLLISKSCGHSDFKSSEHQQLYL